MIKEIRIWNFRSHSQLHLSGITPFFALTGANGSGKSNVFRALNAFFNGEVEPGRRVDLIRDHCGTTQKKRKKQVRVACHFVLPGEFNFHTALRSTADRLGFLARDFWIQRSWQYGATGLLEQRLESSSGGGGEFSAVPPECQAAVEMLLTRLIRFRYLPNYVHPLATVRNEANRLQEVLLTKIRRSKTLRQVVNPEAQLRAMAAVADDLIRPVTGEMQKMAGLASVKIDPPTDWTQVALALGVSLQAGEDERRDAEVHGSGHQSVLSLALLHLLDSQFSAGFGWHQANVWAIEEPESYLHHELCGRLAALLKEYADSPRFQILVTTHAPIVMAYVGAGANLCSAQPSPTTLTGRDLIEASTRAGASPFVHPLLQGETKPLLVVEGPTDVKHINSAYTALGRPNPWEVRAVQEYNVTPGVAGFDQLLKHHGQIIAARRAESPIVLLLDYREQPDKVNRLDQGITQLHPRSRAVQWDRSNTNPELDGDSFSGIEAYLATKAVTECASATGITLLTPAGKSVPISMKKTDTTEVKKQLAAFCKSRTSPDDYSWFGPCLDYTEAAAGLRKPGLFHAATTGQQ